MTLLLLFAILLGSFTLSALAAGLRPARPMSVQRRGQISLGLLFLFTGLGHFVETDKMIGMLPSVVPGRRTIVLASGIAEWLLAFGLLMSRTARIAGISALVFLVAVFPGNIYAAVNRVDIGGHGAGPAYLLVRGPFQLLLLWWAYWFAVRPERPPLVRTVSAVEPP
jgi:uncharacterized membrane protein